MGVPTATAVPDELAEVLPERMATFEHNRLEGSPQAVLLWPGQEAVDDQCLRVGFSTWSFDAERTDEQSCLQNTILYSPNLRALEAEIEDGKVSVLWVALPYAAWMRIAAASEAMKKLVYDRATMPELKCKDPAELESVLQVFVSLRLCVLAVWVGCRRTY